MPFMGELSMQEKIVMPEIKAFPTNYYHKSLDTTKYWLQLLKITKEKNTNQTQNFYKKKKIST